MFEVTFKIEHSGLEKRPFRVSTTTYDKTVAEVPVMELFDLDETLDQICVDTVLENIKHQIEFFLTSQGVDIDEPESE